MSWASLGVNDWIAKTDVENAIATGLTYVTGTAPSISSNQWITRDQLLGWVNCTSTAGSSTQWVTKNTVTLIPSTGFYCMGYSAASCTTACANYAPC